MQKTGQLPGRVIFVDLFTKNHTKLRLIQVYVPPYNDTDPNKQTRIQIRQYLQDIMSEASRLHMHVMIMGDFNDHMDKLQDAIDTDSPIPPQSHILHDLLNRDFVDVLEPFHDNYLTNPRFHTFKHSANNSTSRIDYQWVSPSLLPNLFYANNYWPDHHVSLSDHGISHTVLLTTNLFDSKSNAKIKQQGVSRKVIDYKSITETKWTDFAKLCDDELRTEASFSDPSNLNLSSTTDINSLWSHLSNVIMRAAHKYLPHKTIHANKRKPLPENLSILSSQWSLINRCYRITTKKRVTKVIPSYPPKDIIEHLNQQLVATANCHELSCPKLPIIPRISGYYRLSESVIATQASRQLCSKDCSKGT